MRHDSGRRGLLVFLLAAVSLVSVGYSSELAAPTFSPRVVASCATATASYEIVCQNGYAYIGNVVIDVRDPENPQFATSYDNGGSTPCIAVGDYLYGFNYGYLRVSDISIPDQPVYIASSVAAGGASHVTVSGDYAYLAMRNGPGSTYEGGYQVIDVSDPTHPAYVWDYMVQWDSASRVAADGDRLFVVREQRIVKYDISDPLNPVSVTGGITIDGVRDLEVADGLAMIVGSDIGFRIYDTNGPSGAVLVGACSIEGVPIRLAVSGDYVYVVERGSGLLIFDIREPSAPTLVGECPISDDLAGIAVSNGYAYVLARYDGMYVVAIGEPVSDAPTQPARFYLHQNTPNPFNPATVIRFDLPFATSVHLVVYDVAGRLVQTLMSGEVVEAGRREISWVGRDRTGRTMPSGTYFYRLRAGDHVETRRMLLLK